MTGGIYRSKSETAARRHRRARAASPARAARAFRAARAAASISAVLVVLACAACTGNSGSSPPTSTTSTGPPTTTALPSPTATLPVAPKAAPTQKSAEAFVRYFWAVYNYSYSNLDTAKLDEFAEPECKFCQSTIEDINQLRASKTRLEGAAVNFFSADAPPVENITRIAVVAVISQDPGKTVKEDGAVHEISGHKKVTSLVALRWSSDSWHVHGVSIDKVGKK